MYIRHPEVWNLGTIVDANIYVLWAKKVIWKQSLVDITKQPAYTRDDAETFYGQLFTVTKQPTDMKQVVNQNTQNLAIYEGYMIIEQTL